ncbi:hypothetical protein FH972_022934 [Carpinus fangiana]|uniref:Uncharacterized protein n=1 Tax=Carpinus fangiana TaxID=176857 RepID=A0A5N6KTQ7_9ROSI|nr:hypothetical protein FH972_022934 [Carpinus fangiana]
MLVRSALFEPLPGILLPPGLATFALRLLLTTPIEVLVRLVEVTGVASTEAGLYCIEHEYTRLLRIG